MFKTKNRILIADDEADIVIMLGSFFENNGYDVLRAYNGVQTLKQAERKPDIILLDINMPGLDGLEVCKRIRDYVPCPILFLTARIEDADKVKGFAVGGDDYIVKPFSLAELNARVLAHLRRENRHQHKAQIKFSGELTVDYSQRCLYGRNEKIPLAKKEFEIVELLSQNIGQVFDKERIYERIWGIDGAGDSSVVAEHIRRVRAKIAPYTDRTYIETVWGCGYKWSK
ncbi:MAG: response regulator transcription factor [Clostridia bacterium]